MVDYDAVAGQAVVHAVDTAAAIQNVVTNITNPVLMQPVHNITWWRGVLRHRNVTINDALAALGTTVENVNETLQGGMTKDDYDIMLRRYVKLMVYAFESRVDTRLHCVAHQPSHNAWAGRSLTLCWRNIRGTRPCIVRCCL